MSSWLERRSLMWFNFGLDCWCLLMSCKMCIRDSILCSESQRLYVGYSVHLIREVNKHDKNTHLTLINDILFYVFYDRKQTCYSFFFYENAYFTLISGHQFWISCVKNYKICFFIISFSHIFNFSILFIFIMFLIYFCKRFTAIISVII